MQITTQPSIKVEQSCEDGSGYTIVGATVAKLAVIEAAEYSYPDKTKSYIIMNASLTAKNTLKTLEPIYENHSAVFSEPKVSANH